MHSTKIAAILAHELEIDSCVILNLVRDPTFIDQLEVVAETLEGYLFPETYFFTFGVDEKQVITAMVQQFYRQIPDSVLEGENTLGYTLNEMLVLASIIEGEAMLASEMDTISSVYHNRLARHIPLQADPTIQFIIKSPPRRLLNRDLKIDSPYNTYKYAGLPPGPINNPGKDAIMAAIYPAQTQYLYFVANGDGSHSFSVTLAEHLRAKKKLDQLRKELRMRKGRGRERN
jgi:UPF0755 protein